MRAAAPGNMAGKLPGCNDSYSASWIRYRRVPDLLKALRGAVGPPGSGNHKSQKPNPKQFHKLKSQTQTSASAFESWTLFVFRLL